MNIKMLFYYIILSAVAIVLVKSQDEHMSSILINAHAPLKVIEAEYSQDPKRLQTQKVSLQLFYESLCPSCIEFDQEFVKVATKLYKYLEVRTYPYGNAHMIKNKDGSVTVKCQHGVPECYGNMLHACVLDAFGADLLALQFNACMMELRSNDTAADKCGKDMKIPVAMVDTIKKCAKGPKGHNLLVHYGKDTALANISYVPYMTINGAEPRDDDLMKDVCAAFTEPPPPCPRDDIDKKYFRFNNK